LIILNSFDATFGIGGGNCPQPPPSGYAPDCGSY